MLDRIQTIDRLLDIAAEYYSSEGTHISINGIISLIEDLSLPSMSTINFDSYPDPPEDNYCPHDLDKYSLKVWCYRQEFFHEILGCIDHISDKELNVEDRKTRKSVCIDALINWEESLEKYGKDFRKQNFKVL